MVHLMLMLMRTMTVNDVFVNDCHDDADNVFIYDYHDEADAHHHHQSLPTFAVCPQPSLNKTALTRSHT